MVQNNTSRFFYASVHMIEITVELLQTKTAAGFHCNKYILAFLQLPGRASLHKCHYYQIFGMSVSYSKCFGVKSPVLILFISMVIAN